MHQIGEAVDHGDVGIVSELLDILVREGANHDAVHIPREHTRRIGDGSPRPI
jgi:hypothetical protein